ncbi:MAG: 4Fe-4S binding protein [Desulfobulbaceae bacterium]|nr:MAG: 4Fe-4S binding protein [Desulfobulbaceae bacterium]
MALKRTPIPASLWRRIGQAVSFAFFLFLFIKTDYSGSDELTWAVNLLFRIDPFLALSAMLAVKALVALMLPAVITVVLTLVFGRFFCGWICPLGSLIDLSRHILTPVRNNLEPGKRQAKYFLLIFLLAASLFGLPLAGYLDPFSMLVRGLTFSLQPALDHAATSFFTLTYRHGPEWLNLLTEPVYALLKEYVLPFASKVYAMSVFSLVLLLAILGLVWLESRFFCRKICPLGALLALFSRFSLLRLHGGSTACGKCRHCHTVCRMAAIDDQRAIATAECILCLDCLAQCPQGRIHYGWRKGGAAEQPTDLSRRAVLASLSAGVLAPLVLPTRPLARHADPLLIRPPGALAEDEFLGRCVRCGECMKVCIGNALHSTWLEAGIEGIFSPRLVSRIGYCEYNCTLCGQVCPTGAISELTREEKHAAVIGRAYFDKNRCLPYSDGIPCIVCEEHCPTPDKAIKFRQAEVLNSRGEKISLLQPYVIAELCIGCGICENRCPLAGAAAVLVTAEGESRHAGRSQGTGY